VKKVYTVILLLILALASGCTSTANVMDNSKQVNQGDRAYQDLKNSTNFDIGIVDLTALLKAKSNAIQFEKRYVGKTVIIPGKVRVVGLTGDKKQYYVECNYDYGEIDAYFDAGNKAAVDSIANLQAGSTFCVRGIICSGESGESNLIRIYPAVYISSSDYGRALSGETASQKQQP
jgi:ABC-type Fe3+-hydroxamate transport system substrate-binding protein